MLDGIAFIDAFGQIGQPGIKAPGAPYTRDEILGEMDRVGVDGALVSHATAKEVEPRWGNRRLLQEVEGSRRLFGVAVFLPLDTGEMGEPEEWERTLDDPRVAAALLLPGEGWHTHGYHVSRRVAGPLFEALLERGMPVIIDAGGGAPSTDHLESILEAYPRLPVILARYHFTRLRNLLPLLTAFPNLYLETSLLQVNGGIEWLCRRYGAERLIFGSNFPHSSLGAAVTPVLLANISEDEKRLIAGGNLLRLIGKRTDDVAMGPDRSLPAVGHPIIDAHGHIGPWAPAWIAEHDAAAAVKTMDRLGVTWLCATSSASLMGDCRLGNDDLARQAHAADGRIIPYATANPHDPDPAGELERCFDELGMRLIKIHPGFHRCHVGDARYDPVWAFAERRRSAVLIHTVLDRSDAGALDRIAGAHPDLRLLLAHAGNSFENADNYVRLATEHPNVYAEITISGCLNGILEYYMSRIPRRLLYGSDMVWRAPESQLGWALFAKLTEEERRLLLYENMLRLLTEVGALPAQSADPSAR